MSAFSSLDSTCIFRKKGFGRLHLRIDSDDASIGSTARDVLQILCLHGSAKILLLSRSIANGTHRHSGHSLQRLPRPITRSESEDARTISARFLSFFQLREQDADVDELEQNWFSCQSASKIYTRYLQLDKDHNGLLSRDELSK